ncbi:hypothetical protein BGO18_03630 [Candidatus Saccharibacteria bacterium 47-87]|nr:hypothetical protein [Candidatus Saccharibacteria bacterium]OJU97231.1 MAG: hypothetical protein BGO18_03630 [Candidatus Saccharibacteria bacterium 47-87]
MANDIFQIPQEFLDPQELNAPQQEVVIDSQNTPEKDVGPYRMFGRAAEEIDMIRESILAQEKPKQGLMQGFQIRLSPSRTPEDELIDEQSFAFTGDKSKKFWLGKKSERSQSPYYKNVADWYYAWYVPETKTWDALHLITSDTHIFKLYNGSEYTPTLEDITNLVTNVRGYRRKVRAMSPLDDSIAALEAEIELEKTIENMPNTVDELIEQGTPTIPDTADELLEKMKSVIPGTVEEMWGKDEAERILKDVYATYDKS